MFKKANLVLAASRTAKHAGGNDASKEWKSSVEKQIKRAMECNEKTRVPFAHSLLEPQADGSVRLARQTLDRGGILKETAKTWTRDELLSEIEKTEALSAELRELTAELSHYKYTLRLDTGWFYTD
jgi:hypothetical protein